MRVLLVQCGRKSLSPANWLGLAMALSEIAPRLQRPGTPLGNNSHVIRPTMPVCRRMPKKLRNAASRPVASAFSSPIPPRSNRCVGLRWHLVVSLQSTKYVVIVVGECRLSFPRHGAYQVRVRMRSQLLMSVDKTLLVNYVRGGSRQVRVHKEITFLCRLQKTLPYSYKSGKEQRKGKQDSNSKSKITASRPSVSSRLSRSAPCFSYP